MDAELHKTAASVFFMTVANDGINFKNILCYNTLLEIENRKDNDFLCTPSLSLWLFYIPIRHYRKRSVFFCVKEWYNESL